MLFLRRMYWQTREIFVKPWRKVEMAEVEFTRPLKNQMISIMGETRAAIRRATRLAKHTARMTNVRRTQMEAESHMSRVEAENAMMQRLVERFKRGGGAETGEEAEFIHKHLSGQGDSVAQLQASMARVFDQQQDMNYVTEEAMKTVMALQKGLGRSLGGTPAAVDSQMLGNIPKGINTSEAMDRIQKLYSLMNNPSTTGATTRAAKKATSTAPPAGAGAANGDLQQILYKLTSQQMTSQQTQGAAPSGGSAFTTVGHGPAQAAPQAATTATSSAPTPAGPMNLPRQPFGASMSTEELKAAVEQIKKQYENFSPPK